jgi:hypothetical protein
MFKGWEVSVLPSSYAQGLASSFSGWQREIRIMINHVCTGGSAECFVGIIVPVYMAPFNIAQLWAVGFDRMSIIL